MTPEGSTHVDTLTGTTSSVSRTDSGKASSGRPDPPTGFAGNADLWAVTSTGVLKAYLNNNANGFNCLGYFGDS